MTTKHQVEVSVEEIPQTRMYVQHVHDAAEEAYEVDQQIKDVKAEYKKTIDELEKASDEKRATLLSLMKEARQKHVDVGGGNFFYVREVKANFNITDEEKAMLWAKKNKCLRIDKVEAKKILLRTPKVPQGWEQVDTEHVKLNASKGSTSQE